jgi:hyperosmotically inducible protein
MEMKRMSRVFGIALAGVMLAAPSLVLASTRSAAPPRDLAAQVRHELVMLPYYSVFDNLQFRVDDNRSVTLLGQVSRPVLKSDAYAVVKSIPGVETVTNNIEVLPLSPFDDQIRRAEARAIYGDSVLSRYAWGAVPPIHIIVKNGQVMLVGAVASQGDKNLAGLRANGVFGVFSVQNDLQVDKS